MPPTAGVRPCDHLLRSRALVVATLATPRSPCPPAAPTRCPPARARARPRAASTTPAASTPPWWPSCPRRSRAPARSSSAPTPPTAQRVPRRRRQDRHRHGRRAVRRGDAEVRRQDRVGARRLRRDHPRRHRAASTTSASRRFTVNAERKKQATMVSYFTAGTQWVTQKGNPKKRRPRQRLRPQHRRPEGHRPGRRRPARSAARRAPTPASRRSRSIVDADQAKVTASVAVGQGRRHARRLSRRPCTPSKPPVAQLELLGEHLRLGPLRLRPARRTRPTSRRPSPTRSRPSRPTAPTRPASQVGHRRAARSATSPSTPRVPDLMTRADTEDRPGAIDARPVRHPWRWVADRRSSRSLVAMVVSSFVTNAKWNFPFALRDHATEPGHRGAV